MLKFTFSFHSIFKTCTFFSVVRLKFKMMLFSFFVVSLILSNVSGQFKNDRNYRIVETKSGAIRGLVMQTFTNQKSYIAFRGIRFGKPPIGELRFKVNIFILSIFGAINSKRIFQEKNRANLL